MDFYEITVDRSLKINLILIPGRSDGSVLKNWYDDLSILFTISSGGVHVH